MRYRKKPVEVEAFQYDGDFIDRHGDYYVPDWAKKAYAIEILFFKDAGELYISTPERETHVVPGDYIICNVRGEIYACKPDIFHDTYEQVEE